ncbi:hypothetical protein AB0B01_11125 [Streptomyces sp. NPDC044571]|uniref:hypothetical protein n=1 Tax=Streptomyces sp. NPDC044571 TaxID=3155371 RepID=UPI0033F49833
MQHLPEEADGRSLSDGSDQFLETPLLEQLGGDPSRRLLGQLPMQIPHVVYLSCATAYADFVVREKHMRDPLQHGLKRTGRSTQVYRRLTDAVAAIQEALEASPVPEEPAQ